MLINPKENLLGYARNGSEADKKMLAVFRRAKREGKMVAVCKRKNGEVFYKTYDQRRPATEKMKAARAKFAELSKSGKLVELREEARQRKIEAEELK